MRPFAQAVAEEFAGALQGAGGPAGAGMLGLGASDRFASRIARCTYAVQASIPYDAADPDHLGRDTFRSIYEGKSHLFVRAVLSVIVLHGTQIRAGE